MTRSLLILAATALAMAALYVAFSRSPALLGGGAVAPQSSPQHPLPAATTPKPGGAATPMPGAALTPPTVASPATNAPAPMPRTQPSTVANTPAPADAAPGAVTLAIEDGRTRGPDVIRVRQGDTVTMTITSDRAGKLEVHGYRQAVQLEPGAAATLSFVAAKSGRFGVDLHAHGGAHVEVTALEVRPK